MADLEERLRAALRSRAQGVTPDPGTWERVQSRTRRRQLLGLAAPATAVAAVAAVAILVVPQLLPSDEEGVELGPADSVEEESPDAIEAEVFPSEAVAVPQLGDRAGAIAWVDGESLELQTPAGESLGRGGLPDGAGVTIAPGSTPEQYVVAAGQVGPDDACGGTTMFLTVADGGGHFAYDRLGECVSPPRFSPDRRFVARIVRDGDEQVLDIRRFTRRGTETEEAVTGTIRNATGRVDVAGWFADAAGREAVYLLDRGEERSRLRVLHFDRVEPDEAPDSGAQADESMGDAGNASDDDSGASSAVSQEIDFPEVAVPPELDLDAYGEVDVEDGWRIVAVAPRSGSDPSGDELLLLQTLGDEARLWVGEADGDPYVLDMPEEIARAEDRAWIASEGDHALVGDGVGGVWQVVIHPLEPILVELDVDWIGAAVLPPDGDPEPVDDPVDPMEEEPVEDGPEATAFFVRATDDGMWVEPATVTLSAPTVGVARASMEALVAGGVEDLETMAPEGTRVLGASIDERVLTVDLSAQVREGNVGAEGEALFAQQLAHTATQFDGVEAVRLHVEGQAVTDLWGHVDWSEPIEPDEFALSPVVIDEVLVTDGTVTVSGDATTFEGTVELTLVNPSGGYAEETFTTAECGGPCRGAWTHTFDAQARTPGTWAVKASEPFVTDEGRPPFETRAELVVE